jgi:D-glycero-D-manno-heptose 1,7-bisphosphate phosphatase
MVKAVFMDRDGTVSEEIGYMYHAGLYRPFPFAGPAVRKINESGMKAVLITNQSGVGRGYFGRETVDEVHGILKAELTRHQARLDGIYMCPHRPDESCACRKPNPGMLIQAQKELNVDLQGSYVIGDKFVDIETAHAVGATGILVMTGYGREELEAHRTNALQPHFVVENLMAAVDGILAKNLRGLF